MDKTTERIKADAERYAGLMVWVNTSNDPDKEPLFHEHISSTSYEAGATAEAANTQRAVDLMQEIINLSDRNQVAWNKAKDFIQQWKDGKKEVCTCDNIQLAAHGECWGCPGRHTREKGVEK